MGQKKSLMQQLKTFKMNVSKDIPIDKLILFGSMATGKTHKWSDVDLIIVSGKFRRLNFFERGAKMYDYWTVKHPVDFICYTPEEFEKMSKRITIVRQALEEGVEV